MSIFEIREGVTLEYQGKKIFGIFHRPLNCETAPVVLCCYGFGGNKAGKNRLWVMLAEHLAREGIATLRFDFRGCGDSEGKFCDLTLESCISDVLVAVNFLENSSLVDSSRMGIIGSSFGGAVSVFASSRYQKFKSMALWAPVANASQWKGDWEKFKEFKDSYEPNPYLECEEGGAGKEFFLQFSQMRPDEEIKKLLHVPLLHIHSEKDDVVLPAHACSYKKGRSEALVESRFITLARCDHWFSQPDDRCILLSETSRWFKKTLLN